ncbi:Vacuolar protein sorting-associated protein 68 [Marasmius tenuissimus]|nr:Vacuolar protein sorting-associated protein 68 [Marasmius tenuissimus]
MLPIRSSSISEDGRPATPVQVAVQVEVEVHDDDAPIPQRDIDSHAQTEVQGQAADAQQQRRRRRGGSEFVEQLSSFFMSLPRADYDPRRVCYNPFPNVDLGKHRRTVGVYLAGGLFTLALWVFLDAAVLSAHAKVPWDENADPPVHVTFIDWIPGICSLLGYAVVNLIDKDRVRGEEGFGDPRSVWRARLFLFIGFALMAGGLAGSVTILVLKYILSDYAEMFKYYGYANVSQNILLMLSAIILWMAQSVSSEYEYNLTL